MRHHPEESQRVMQAHKPVPRGVCLRSERVDPNPQQGSEEANHHHARMTRLLSEALMYPVAKEHHVNKVETLLVISSSALLRAPNKTENASMSTSTSQGQTFSQNPVLQLRRKRIEQPGEPPLCCVNVVAATTEQKNPIWSLLDYYKSGSLSATSRCATSPLLDVWADVRRNDSIDSFPKRTAQFIRLRPFLCFLLAIISKII